MATARCRHFWRDDQDIQPTVAAVNGRTARVQTPS